MTVNTKIEYANVSPNCHNKIQLHTFYLLNNILTAIYLQNWTKHNGSISGEL